MCRYLLRGAAAAALMLLGLNATVIPALAHGRGERVARSISGVVTSVDGQNLLVQTQIGSVAVGLTSSTHVIRRVMGSTADLSRGEVIDLVAPRGQTTVRTIHIYAPGTSLPTKNPAKNPVHTEHPTHFARPPRPGHPPAAMPERGPAQIVALTDTTVTVRYGDGRNATYTFAGNLTVVKDLIGQVADMAVGQMVSVRFKIGNPAVADWITILRS